MSLICKLRIVEGGKYNNKLEMCSVILKQFCSESKQIKCGRLSEAKLILALEYLVNLFLSIYFSSYFWNGMTLNYAE
jgi:hypothetical protein